MTQVLAPSLAFLEEVERLFSVVYPKPFRAFCARYEANDVLRDYPQLAGGEFVYDLAGLADVNAQIGRGAWDDYDAAIVGKVRPKDGMKLWDGVLPIYVEGGDVYGFDVARLPSDVVVAWAVHCVVHEYPSMAPWLEALPLP